jgi:hypothetical protein
MISKKSLMQRLGDLYGQAALVATNVCIPVRKLNVPLKSILV